MRVQERVKMDIKTSKGVLTPYGFSCGYVETWQDGQDSLTLGMDHNCYYVKGFINGKRVIEFRNTLMDARQLFQHYQTKGYSREAKEHLS